eukprot:TRINITY_DN5101_c0_g1_i3.p1 TRINITY_DN5101_c0_g1~~TRINITY_DN5101_c0_g1_i3.p1  ORF type:complete len:857 (+),score=252.61 TRINITY_DN5101_c0_g1_i3:105-2675(+)
MGLPPAPIVEGEAEAEAENPVVETTLFVPGVTPPAEGESKAARGAPQQNVLDDDDALAAQDETTKAMVKALNKGSSKVDKDNLLEYVQTVEMQKQVFLQLPFSVLYFASFIVMVFGHLSIYNSGMVQRQHRSMLAGTTYEGVQFTSGHKDIEDIDTKEDIYTFLKEVVAPMYIQPYGPEDPYRNLRYNQLVGGVLIQQMRRNRVVCGTQNPLMSSFECYPWYSESRMCYDYTPLTGWWCPDSHRLHEERGRGGCLPCWERIQVVPEKDEEGTARRLDYVQEGGGSGGHMKGVNPPSPDNTFTVYLNEYEGIDRAIEKLDMMQDHGWIDFRTSWVGIKFLVLNPDLGMFVHVLVSVYIAPSGIFLPHITMQSFQPMFFMDTWVMVWDIVWLLMLIWFTIRVILGFVKAGKERTIGAFLRNGWTWVDIFCVLGGYVLMMTYLALFGGLSLVKDKAMDVRVNDPLQPNVSSYEYPFAGRSYEDYVMALHWEASDLSYNFMWGKILLCWYTVMIAVKFFQCFSAQPKLAVVTNTLVQAGTDVAHFLIVFIVIFFAFVISGMFMYGRRMWEFSSFTQSSITCFLMCLGEFDMNEYMEDMQYTGFLWFFLFQVLLILLMLNMLMAIIMDVYTEVKADAASATAIWDQGVEVIQDTIGRLRGKKAGSASIISHISELQTKSGQVDEKDLIEHVGSAMSEKQAKSIIAGTKHMEQMAVDKGVSMSDAMKMIGFVKIACTKIEKKLDEVIKEERNDLDDLRALYDPLAAGVDIDCLNQGPPEPEEYNDGVGMSVRDGMKRLDFLETRLSKVEEFLQEAVQYTNFRGKDLRNHLLVIEDLLRSKRDTMPVNIQHFEEQPPTLLSNR